MAQTIGSTASFTCYDMIVFETHYTDNWTAAQRDIFYDFVTAGGSLFAYCHDPYEIENSTTSSGQRLNFLTNSGIIPGKVSYNTGDYVFDPGSAGDPIMQIMADPVQGLSQNSGPIYAPNSEGWRPSTTVPIYYPNSPAIADGTTPGRVGHLAYGNAFGSAGTVFYMTGHLHSAPNNSAMVAESRLFANYLLIRSVSTNSKRPPELSVVEFPDDYYGGEIVDYEINVDYGIQPVTIQWTSECGGTFSDPNSEATEFLAPHVKKITTCLITATVTDNCGKTAVYSSEVTISPFIENNYIEESQILCPGTVPEPFVGSQPTGGDEVNYVYRWEMSTTGPATGFTIAPGDYTGRDYTPGVITQTTWFRRAVTSAEITDYSSSIEITMKPTPVVVANDDVILCEGEQINLSSEGHNSSDNTFTSSIYITDGKDYEIKDYKDGNFKENESEINVSVNPTTLAGRNDYHYH